MLSALATENENVMVASFFLFLETANCYLFQGK